MHGIFFIIHKLQARQNLPHRIYTNYKCCTTCHTGSTQITSGTCPLYFLAKRQLVTGSHVSQDLHKLQVGYVLYTSTHRAVTDSNTSQNKSTPGSSSRHIKHYAFSSLNETWRFLFSEMTKIKKKAHA